MKRKIITSALSLAFALQCVVLPVNAQPENVPVDEIAIEDEFVPVDEISIDDEEFEFDAVSEETAELMAKSKYGDYLYYRINDDKTGVTITDCNTAATEIVIPSEIAGLPVTSIGGGAFYECSSLTSVTIPDSVTSIGAWAFDGCSSLTSVYISDIAAWCNISFNYYYANPLYYAKNLYLNNELVTELVIPDSVTSIGSYAFYYCSSLTSVYYNASTVFANAFDVSDYYCKNNIALVVLGDNVTSIDASAFSDCKNLKKIMIPKSVSEIEYGTFKNCSKLVTVEYGGSEDDWDEIYIGSGNDYLESATIKYNSALYPPQNIPLTESTVSVTEEDEKYSFNIKTEQSYINSYVYVILYDGDGNMLSSDKARLDLFDDTVVSVDKLDGAVSAKVFVWTNNMQPTTKVQSVEL